MRPLIGIPCHAGIRTTVTMMPGAQVRENPTIYYNNTAYIRAVEHAGGVPILIPIFDDLSRLNAVLPLLDGLLLSGGIDVDPQFYHEDKHPCVIMTNPQIDELELALARWAIQQDLPTLGLCRGMQILNVVLGGNLYQDLASQYPDSLRHSFWDLPRDEIVHTITVEPGSMMEKVLGTREVPANSLHHQATKNPGEGVYICGYSSDGVAEMLEIPGQRFMLAVQCHPEELYIKYPVWSRLFEAFIDASARNKSGSLPPPVGVHI